MIRLLIATIALFAMSYPAPALADDGTTPFSTGNAFIRSCDEPSWRLACATFALGVFQGSQLAERTICLRPNVDNGQLLEISKAYIRSHPEQGDFLASVLLFTSWKLQFPCAK